MALTKNLLLMIYWPDHIEHNLTPSDIARKYRLTVTKVVKAAQSRSGVLDEKRYPTAAVDYEPCSGYKLNPKTGGYDQLFNTAEVAEMVGRSVSAVRTISIQYADYKLGGQWLWTLAGVDRYKAMIKERGGY